ncbi:hypothetical protein Ga0466249_004871 [Sporomusaceae bacterium BoRhaA]|nr:hypothetical protein [Pelorhabdus rhamnosifermentans]
MEGKFGKCKRKYGCDIGKKKLKGLFSKSRKDDGNWHFLAEVGSASNWGSFTLR